MTRKNFIYVVLLISSIIFLSSTAAYAETTTETFMRRRINQPAKLSPQAISSLQSQSLSQSPSLNTRVIVPKPNQLSSRIVNPKSLIKQNLNTNLRPVAGKVKPSPLSSHIISPQSLLQKRNFDLKPYNNKLAPKAPKVENRAITKIK